MKRSWQIVIVVVLAGAVAVTFAARGAKRAADRAANASPVDVAPAPSAPVSAPALALAPAPAVPIPVVPPPAPPVEATSPETSKTAAPRPRFLELGSNRCMACQEMAKVLASLRLHHGEKLQVDFIDVFEDLEAHERYQILLIPTQIFYDAAGKEIFRHTGLISEDGILAKFRELGVKL